MPDEKKVKAEVSSKPKTSAAKGGKKSKKMGRNTEKCKRYRLNSEREKHKIIKIAKSSGVKRALEYAVEKGILAFAQRRLANYKVVKNAHGS